MEKKGNKHSVNLEAKKQKPSIIEVDTILEAVGRRPNTEDIGLDSVGIGTEKGFIPVGDYYRTEKPNIPFDRTKA